MDIVSPRISRKIARKMVNAAGANMNTSPQKIDTMPLSSITDQLAVI
jgi:hypothetical protein